MTKIRSIRVFSAAKVNGLLYGILGLLLAPLFLFGPGLQMLGGDHRVSGVAGLILFAAVLPFFYAVFGFISGALLGFIYNAISQAIGGIEVELEPRPATMLELRETSSSSPIPSPSSDVSPPPPAEFE